MQLHKIHTNMLIKFHGDKDSNRSCVYVFLNFSLQTCIQLPFAYLKHLPVTGKTLQLWQKTPRCLSGFSLSAGVRSFAAFFTCSWSNFKELKSSLHRGHFTFFSLSESLWWSAHTFMQEMWTLLPQPNLGETKTAREAADNLSAQCCKKTFST